MRQLQLVVFAVVLKIISTSHRTFPYQVLSRLNGTDVEVRWKPDWERQVVHFSVQLSGSPIAWFLVGFSDHGKYRGSDFCKFDGVDVLDGYIARGLVMERDFQQDCIYYGRYRDGSFRFTRKFQTCDMRDYAIEVSIFSGKVYSQVAYNLI
uniref:DOMON domain-containing protein n=1 Tax=Ascaris lumbricoides TaxID=6252 RepID=A0A0M3IUE4_ASCLU